MPRLATPGSGCVGQAVHLHREDAAGRRLPVREAQVERREAELAAQLAAMHHVAADAVGPAQQRAPRRPCRRGPAPRARRNWRRAGRAPRSCSCARRRSRAPGRRRRASRSRRRAWRRSGSRRPPARTSRPGPRTSTSSMKASGTWLDSRASNGQHDALVDAAGGQFGELVAQRGDARRRQFRLAVQRGEVVARMRLEGQHAAGHARGGAPRCSAAPAWPGGRGARHRSCRW